MATIFDQIIDRSLPADIVYEDDLCLAFKDVNPQAPIHILLIPKKQIEQLSMLEEKDQSLLGHMMITAKKIAEEQDMAEGFRLVINNGPSAGQSVYHLHMHLLGGRTFSWPPG
jgi:histidine triad (HIT) family protein